MLRDAMVLLRPLVLLTHVAHDGAHGEVAEPMHDVPVPVRRVHDLRPPPLEPLKIVVDVRPERVKRAADSREHRELRSRRRFVPSEVVRHASRADNGDIPVGRITSDGSEAVVADGPEEDAHPALSVVVEGCDGCGDGIAARVGMDDAERATCVQASSTYRVQGVLDRR